MTTLLVSFHGGGGAGSINNVVAFDGGTTEDLLSTASTSAVVHPLRELRKFLFSPSGHHLYVANGSKDLNQVLRFTPSSQAGGQWQYESIYASDQLAHPFDVVFGFGDALFVSNQDTNVVTSYASANSPADSFVEGFTAVRGLAYDGTNLYVADSGNGQVGVYDAGRTKVGDFEVAQPVHLLYDPANRWLFVGSESGDSVLAWNPATPAAAPITVVSGAEPKIDHTAGLALQPGSGRTATLYVVSRVGRQVLSFPLDFSSGQPAWTPETTTVVLTGAQLSDDPEFVGVQGGLYG
jgi:DNA-binding beta-propeller fold protein YncE